MALAATTIGRCFTTGDDTNNAGLFDPGQTAGMFTDGAATSATGNSPVFSSASYNFVAGDVGACIYIASGTNWTPGWYPIASVAANAATLSAAIGQATGKVTMTPNTVAGCATVASPTSATWTIDYSQQATAQFTYTDLASVGAGLTVSSAAKPFAKQQVGNGLVITGGTNFTTGRWVIASVAAGVATLVGPANVTTGAGVNGTGGQGGAFASPGQWGAVKVAGNDLTIKNGTYSITTASTNVAGGCLIGPSASAAANNSSIIGYASVVGDLGTPPLLQASGITNFTIIQTGSGNNIENVAVDGASLTGSKGFDCSTNTYAHLFRCKASNCTNNGFAGATGTNLVGCEGTGCSTQPVYTGVLYAAYCSAHDNTVTGFTGINVGATLFRCASVNNTGASSDGFVGAGANNTFNQCYTYSNGRDGFRLGNSSVGRPDVCIKCLAVLDGGYGFTAAGAQDNDWLYYCAAYNTASGAVNSTNISARFQMGFVTLTGNPYTNAAGNDFSLNNTANQGAACRGIVGLTWLGLSTTDYSDIGGAQHADPASSGGVGSMVAGGLVHSQ